MDNFKEMYKKLNIEYDKALNPEYKRENGIYYTPIDLASYLINELFLFGKITRDELLNFKFLEPCVGTGNYVFAYLDLLKKFKFTKEEFTQILNNIYVADIDDNSIKIYSDLLKLYSKEYYDITLDDDYFVEHTANGLLYKNVESKIEWISISKAFGKEIKFDIIATNPPYKNLKAEKDSGNEITSFEDYKSICNEISKHVKKNFKYASDGVLNLYKLFVEDIISNYSNNNCLISLLIPSSILNDKSCEKLRNLVFDKSKVFSINCIKENNSYFNATQSLCSICLKTDCLTDKFRIDNNFDLNGIDAYTITNYIETKKITGGNSILCLTLEEIETLKQLSKFTRLKDINYIVNLRGELDLTQNKDKIQSSRTDFKLLRGRDISLFTIKNIDNTDFVSQEFVDSSLKAKYIFNDRIACQQIANVNKEKRVVFAYIPKNYVLGNSCNFISLNNAPFNLYYLLGLFNSSLINWYFKLRSSNNHINNYEIDEFPIPLDNPQLIKEISALSEQMVKKGFSPEINQKLDELVYEIYGIDNKRKNKSSMGNNDLTAMFKKDVCSLLKVEKEFDINFSDLINAKTEDDIKRILKEYYPNDKFIQRCLYGMVQKYNKLVNGCVLNNVTYKLSDLDLEMIECVPPGGNWKNIKPEVVAKSKRLTKITQTGGRTTLYGRIDYDKPCYTITTFFNRPGNGTYAHPKFNRVLTVREAARIQSFDDDYYFVGNKTDYLKQIGNAVPPIMAREIGLAIKSKIDIKYSVDLFAGAGGLTSGLKQAGITSLVGVDFEEKACETLKINNPEIDVLCGDLTKDETKQYIYNSVRDKKVDILVGGPPCQGFSMAGFRNPDDPRNKLFWEYIDVLKNLKPKVLIMENVEGMKSMEKGEVYKTILSEFDKLGYAVEGRMVFANEHGVPQKRKRLITIGIIKELQISPSELFPDIDESIVTARDAIEDMETIELSDNAVYKAKKQSKYVQYLRRNIK